MNHHSDPFQRQQCGKCGAYEGEMHTFGCSMDLCPFCLGYYADCDCAYEQLGLVDRQRFTKTTSYLPPDIYNHGLTDDHYDAWDAILTAKGRYPYIEYPQLCVRCGTLWPEHFMVDGATWDYYVQPDQRRQILCLPCFYVIVRVIDLCAGRDLPLPAVRHLPLSSPLPWCPREDTRAPDNDNDTAF